MKISSAKLLALLLQFIAFQIITTHGQNVSSECKHINKTIAASKLIADFVVSRNVEQIIINNLKYDDKGNCIFYANSILFYIWCKYLKKKISSKNFALYRMRPSSIYSISSSHISQHNPNGSII